MKLKRLTIALLSITILCTLVTQVVYGASESVTRASRVENTYDWKNGVYSMESEKGTYVTISGVKSTQIVYNENSYDNVEIEPSIGYAYYMAKTSGLNNKDMQSIVYMSDRWGNTSNLKVRGSKQEIDGISTLYRRATQYGTVYYGILKDAITNNKKVLRIKDEESVRSNIKVLVDQQSGTYTVGPYKLELNVASNEYTSEAAKILYNELIRTGNEGYSKQNAFAKVNQITGMNVKEGTQPEFIDEKGKIIVFPDFTPGKEKNFYVRFIPANDGAIINTGNPIINASYLTKFTAEKVVKGTPTTIKFGDASQSVNKMSLIDQGDLESTEIVEQTVTTLEEREYGSTTRIQLDSTSSSILSLLSGTTVVETSAMRKVGTGTNSSASSTTAASKASTTIATTQSSSANIASNVSPSPEYITLTGSKESYDRLLKYAQSNSRDSNATIDGLVELYGRDGYSTFRNNAMKDTEIIKIYGGNNMQAASSFTNDVRTLAEVRASNNLVTYAKANTSGTSKASTVYSNIDSWMEMYENEGFRYLRDKAMSDPTIVDSYGGNNLQAANQFAYDVKVLSEAKARTPTSTTAASKASTTIATTQSSLANIASNVSSSPEYITLTGSKESYDRLLKYAQSNSRGSFIDSNATIDGLVELYGRDGYSTFRNNAMKDTEIIKIYGGNNMQAASSFTNDVRTLAEVRASNNLVTYAKANTSGTSKASTVYSNIDSWTEMYENEGFRYLRDKAMSDPTIVDSYGGNNLQAANQFAYDVKVLSEAKARTPVATTQPYTWSSNTTKGITVDKIDFGGGRVLEGYSTER